MCPPVTECLRTLRGWRLPPLRQALAELSGTREELQLLYLYRHYFPEAYAASASECRRTDASYSPRAREFLALVDERLFPVDLDWLELEDDTMGTLVPPIINPSCFELELDELALPLRVLVALLAINEPDAWRMLCAQIGHRAPVPVTADGASRVDWERFSALCASHGGLMAQVPFALDVIGHATGNLWLDLDENSMGCERFEWAVESLDFLAGEWQRAQPLIDQYEAVLAWLTEHPRALGTIIRLWNRSVQHERTA